MDPLSVTSGVVGLIATAVQVAQASDIKSLAALLATTQSLYDTYGNKSVQDAATFGVTLDICLQRCIGPLKGLEELLKPFGAGSAKKRSLGRVLSSFTWVMKKGAIKGLKDRLKDAKASLTLTVSVLSGYISGKGQEQIQHDIVAGYERLQRDFLDLERGRDLKRRLALDVASVRGTEDSQSLSEYTDAGLPLRRFFASAHQWNSGYSNLEPPLMETIASESVFDDDTFEHSIPTPSPLVQAVLSGDQATVDRLLKAGSSILERSHDGLSLLHLCIVTNNRILAAYILDQDTERALLNSKDASRRTPFMFAVEEKSTEVASLLVERGCSLGDFMSIAMDLLESGQEDEEIRKLLKPVAKRMRESSRGPYPLHQAVQGKNHYLLNLLLEAGFDPDAKDEKGIQAIFYAVSTRNMRAIICLGRSRANLNVYLAQARRPGIGVEVARECTPLLLAGHIIQDHAVTRLLLQLGARADFICPKYNDTRYVKSPDLVISLLEYRLNICNKAKDRSETIWQEALSNMQDIGDLPVLELRVATWRVRNWERGGKMSSPEFECGGQRWRITVNTSERVSAYLVAIDPNIGSGHWHSNAQFSLGMSNIYDPSIFTVKHSHHRFTEQVSSYGFERLAYKVFATQEGQSRPIVQDDAVDISLVIRVAKDPTGVIWNRFVSYSSKKATGHVGIINQGAVGYMSCILQVSFFICSLRRAIYQIPTEDAEPRASVALAIQRIFYNLQVSSNAVATTELTASFGWKELDVTIPRDAVEFHRVLQDKLTKLMKGTSVETAIDDVYSGNMRSCFKCISVDYEYVRKETFFDLQLEVRGMKTLYDSFKDYVSVRLLDGYNKYNTVEFGPQDAKSGIIFDSFPSVLSLQLKRFQYDIWKDKMVKNNDRHEYPSQIDLAEFLDVTADRSQSWVYNLFGVVVHSGDVSGGFYFTFIKPSRTEGWLKLHDDQVTRAAEKEVFEGCYGGEPIGSTSSLDESNTPDAEKTSTQAYILFYIRDSVMDEVLKPVDDWEIPSHLKPLMITFRSWDRNSLDFQLAFSKEELYDGMASKVSHYLQLADPFKLQFWTTYPSHGVLKAVINPHLNQSLGDILCSDDSDSENKAVLLPDSMIILYQEIATSA
ncbi:hypothetical protein C8R44DRAFT_795304 [Mycena epipterygia]|nr:hypothetical protein C8R44DRAFT_795304 [Mycena epipterygia]